MSRVLGNISCQIMYFLINATSPKLLDVATPNFADALVRSKAGICDGVPSTEVELYMFKVKL